MSKATKASSSKNKISRARLSVNKKDFNVKRHPSIKTLMNQMNDPELLNFNNNNINITTSNDNNIIENNCVNEVNEKVTNPTNIGINIITCDHKIINDEDTYFIEADPNQNTNINIDNEKNKLMINKPKFYELNEEQKQFDKKITNLMIEGKDYKTIEKQFQNILKK